MIRAALVAVLLGSPALATEKALSKAEAVALATTESRDWCTGKGGKLELEDVSADAVDLTGDGSADDWIVVETSVFCGPDFGYLGGSGGVMLHAIVGSRLQSWLGGAWVLQPVAFTVEGETLPATPVLILGLHGSSCNSFGAAPCMLALTWDGERLIGYESADGAEGDGGSADR